MPQKTQPMGFSGRREAIRAPTVWKVATNRIAMAKLTALLTASLDNGYSAVNTMVNAMSATVNAHNDQASRKALRTDELSAIGLRPPTSRRTLIASTVGWRPQPQRDVL